MTNVPVTDADREALWLRLLDSCKGGPQWEYARACEDADAQAIARARAEGIQEGRDYTTRLVNERCRQEGREAEREMLTPLVVVLRDRLFASTIYAGASVNEADHHESADQVIVRNQEAIRKCDAMDPSSRAHERWELEAAARLAALEPIARDGKGF